MKAKNAAFVDLPYLLYNAICLRNHNNLNHLPLCHRKPHGLITVVAFNQLFVAALGFNLALGHDQMIASGGPTPSRINKNRSKRLATARYYSLILVTVLFVVLLNAF